MDKGLEAIPEAKRKQFCENLFKRLCDKNEIFKEFYINDGRMFPNKYYQQFYEKYMTGKDTGDFSVNDIIGIIVELSEKDDKFKPIISDLRKYYIDESAIKQETEKSIDVAKQISEKGVKMKTREEIEEYLGIKIKSVKEDSSKNAYEITEERGAEYGEDIEPTTVRYNAFLGEFEKNKKVLDKESENALLKLLKESIDKGDMETADTCHSILQEDSTFYKNHPNAIGLNFQQGTALFEYEQEKRARIEQVEELKIEQLTEDGIEQRVDDKVQQEETLKQEYIENNDEKTEKQENVRFEQYEKAIEEEQAKIKEEQEAQMQEYRKARLDEKKKEEERHSEIEKEWNQYQDYENVIAQNTEIGELTESIKYEIFLAEVNGQFSSKMKELIEKVNDLPENERKIVMKEYKHFAEIGNNFEINEQGEIIRNSKTQEVAETERVKPKEENIKDVVENDEKKELDNCQQPNEMMHQEGLRKNDFLSLEYQEVEINDSDLKKAHDILSRTKNKSEIEQVYNQEQK